MPTKLTREESIKRLNEFVSATTAADLADIKRDLEENGSAEARKVIKSLSFISPKINVSQFRRILTLGRDLLALDVAAYFNGESKKQSDKAKQKAKLDDDQKPKVMAFIKRRKGDTGGIRGASEDAAKMIRTGTFPGLPNLKKPIEASAIRSMYYAKQKRG